MTPRSALALAACLALVLPGCAARAAPFGLARILDDPTPAEGDLFGNDVALDRGRLVVGTPLDDTTGFNTGQVLLFDAASGALRQTFEDPDPRPGERFGEVVAVSGNRVLVGARFDDTSGRNAGRAFLFDADSGALLQSFSAPDPSDGDLFGINVAISGDNVLIGARFDDANGPNTGRAFLFDAESGALLQTFEDPDPERIDRFGERLTIEGDNVLIGGQFDDANGPDAGQVFLFDAATGDLVRTFSDPDPAEGDRFGSAVAISGDNVLVGARLDDANGPDAGRAFLFDAATGDLLQTFDDPLPGTGDEFGERVAISGDTVVIGTREDDTNGTDAGRAFVFDALTGALQQVIDAPNPSEDAFFASSLAFEGDTLVIGARRDDTNGTDAGRAFVYTRQPALVALPDSLGLYLGALGLGALAWRRRRAQDGHAAPPCAGAGGRRSCGPHCHDRRGGLPCSSP